MSAATTPAWKARRYSQADLPAIGRLYEAVHATAFDCAYWKWLFEANPAGPGAVWLAVDGDTVVGQYATMPAAMTIGGKRLQAAQSLHTMTHPSYRRLGIFTVLAHETYAALARAGTPLVYGFPNDQSFHGFVKHLDFFVLEDLAMRARPLRMASILGTRLHRPALCRALGAPLQRLFERWIALARRAPQHENHLVVRTAAAFPADIDRLAGEQTQHFPNAIIRDRGYLTWRYGRHPNRSYEIYLAYDGDILSGYCVCGRTRRMGLDVGLLVELYAAPSRQEILDHLIGEALEGMRARGAALAACVLPAASPFQATLRRHGFRFTLRRFPYILRSAAGAGPDPALLKGGRWHITFGDADFV